MLLAEWAGELDRDCGNIERSIGTSKNDYSYRWVGMEDVALELSEATNSRHSGTELHCR